MHVASLACVNTCAEKLVTTWNSISINRTALELIGFSFFRYIFFDYRSLDFPIFRLFDSGMLRLRFMIFRYSEFSVFRFSFLPIIDFLNLRCFDLSMFDCSIFDFAIDRGFRFRDIPITEFPMLG